MRLRTFNLREIATGKGYDARVLLQGKSGTYIIFYDGEHVECTCASFVFRGSCKHADAVKDVYGYIVKRCNDEE